MTQSLMHVTARDKGQYPISIGTSLALEGALGVYPERPESPPPLRQYDEVWINVYTLFRNLGSAIKKEAMQTLLPDELLPGLVEDMCGAAQVLESAQPHLQVVFYMNDYRDLAKVYPKAKLKEPSNVWQEMLQDLEQATLKLLVQHRPDVTLKSYKLTITEQHGKALMLTHLPVDLLNRYRFSKLDLLESHSGKIKPPPLWHTKLTPKDDMERMPFNAFTLQVFGDHATQFHPQPLPLRRAVVELSKDHRWTPITTVDKIQANINTLTDNDLKQALLALL